MDFSTFGEFLSSIIAWNICATSSVIGNTLVPASVFVVSIDISHIRCSLQLMVEVDVHSSILKINVLQRQATKFWYSHLYVKKIDKFILIYKSLSKKLIQIIMLSYISLKVYTNFGTLPILFIKAFLHKILSEQNRCAIACQRHNTVFVLLLKRQLITSSKVFIIKLIHTTKYQESFIAYKNKIVVPLQGYFCKQFFLEFLP